MELFGRTKNADTTLLFTWVQLSSCLAAALGTKGGEGEGRCRTPLPLIGFRTSDNWQGGTKD